MNHIAFIDKEQYPTALLIKESYLKENEIKEYYPNIELAFGLDSPTKITVSQARKSITKLLPSFASLGITTLYVCDANYFKALTGKTKAESYIGYILPCSLKDYEYINIILGINYGQLMYNPNLSAKLDLSLDTLNKHLNGEANNFDIIHNCAYTDENLNQLINAPMLAIDIETTGLHLGSQILSIGFAIDKHNGIAFKVTDKVKLKWFFEHYKGYTIFHNATFDIRHIIYNIFMKHDNDMDGLLYGLDVMYRNLHDTKIIAYLATNNTQGNTLSLKELSHEYAGNYGIDVKNLTQITDEILEYNLKDCLCTYYVYEKYYPMMVKDNQLDIYKNLMLPSLKSITQMELIGMPIELGRVAQAKQELSELVNKHLETINNSRMVQGALQLIKGQELAKLNAKLKTKQHDMSYLADYQFNPNSGKHLQVLFYEYMQFPVIDYTDSKQPATGTKTLEKLLNHTTIEEIQELINAFIGLSKANKILTTFIPAFEQAKPRNNWHYLHGSFNLGSTLSNRLSSSNPNLQQIPSGSTFGSLIKSCFKPPKGWLFVGSDFASLEDRINALLTKDENKLKVYTDGFDGHSLRAYYYFKDQMPDIDPNDVDSINSVAKKYKHLRQASKAPTFALTYGGTYLTLMNNCGFDEQTAKQIEANYHELYKQSDQWTQDKLALCEQQGYIDVAFGLRIRTPIVSKSVLNTSKTPNKVSAEARSVGNSISGQSFCSLTMRALNAVMAQIWQSEYRTDILPVCSIHDALYFMIRDDIRIVEWFNKLLIKEMSWQELPEIQHDKVHLEAELDIFHPDWSNPITIPNNANKQEIKDCIKNNI